MFWSFCAPKGGVGTSVVAAATALESARLQPTVLIDFGGDLAHVFGLDVEGKHGVHDWLAASDEVGTEALSHLLLDVAPNLSLMLAGPKSFGPTTPDRAVRFVEAMKAISDLVIADVGAVSEVVDPRSVICVSGDRTTCVVRACYLALRRFSKLPVLVDDIVEIEEPGRALRTLDIEAVAGLAVSARIPFDPSIARAVDAGLLGQRMPRSLRRNVRVLIEDRKHLAVAR